MNISEIIDNARRRLGIAELNPMQRAVAESAARRLILLAPTGSGKTLAYLTAALRRIGAPGIGLRILVIAPARELVVQIAGVVKALAPGLRCAAFYGGHSMPDELRSVAAAEPDVVVATPGRLLDHLNRSSVSLDRIESLVLDEYDKSLELGFAGEMRRIVRRMEWHVPGFVALTSATKLAAIPDYLALDGAEMLDFAKGPEHEAEVRVVTSPDRDKLPTLLALLRSLPRERTLVFVNHRESAGRVYAALSAAGMPAGIYHGGLEQHHRQLALDLFDNGTTPILVSTDLGSRGLDIDGVKAVVHYHLPSEPEVWTHRNGRTDRYGAGGAVYAIVSDGESVPGGGRPFRIGEAAGESGVRMASLYFNAGKKEKLSRGDVAGFIIRKGGIEPSAAGVITVRDHYALAAVPESVAGDLYQRLRGEKIKGQRVKITLITKLTSS